MWAAMSMLFVLFISMVWDNVSELQPQTGLLFIPQVIYECGEQQWNDVGRGKPVPVTLVQHKSHMD
jgi:hypothetical protein